MEVASLSTVGDFNATDIKERISTNTKAVVKGGILGKHVFSSFNIFITTPVKGMVETQVVKKSLFLRSYKKAD